MRKRVVATALALFMVLGLLPGTAWASGAVIQAGSCGPSALWGLDSSGTLMITGFGEIEFNDFFSPWYRYRDDIKNVSIGDGITQIPEKAFYNCTHLTDISLPVTLEEIEEEAFFSCGRLRNFHYAGSVEQWNRIDIDTRFNNDVLYAAESRIYYMGSPGTTTILSGTCGINTTWTLSSDGVLTIGGSGSMSDYYGGSAAPWAHRRVDIKKIVINTGVTSIGRYVFQNFNNLADLTFPTSLKVVDSFALSGCDKLRNVYYSGTPAQWKAIQIDFSNRSYLDPQYANVQIHYGSSGETSTYTVTFDPDGGSGPTTEKEYKANAALGTLPTPTRNGYKFNGWYTAETGGTKVSASTKVTGDMTLYARWTKNPTTKTYTITLDPNGGTVTPKTLSVNKNAAYYSQLPTPTRAGYKFDGWYTTRTGTTKISSTTKATSSRTIYAHWTRDTGGRTRMVTFDPNGGTVGQEWKAVMTGTTYRDLPTPTRPGYHFKGWYTRASGGTKITSTTRVTVTGNQTLYAQWQSSAAVRSTQSGSWRVTVPANYALALYTSSSSARASTSIERSSYLTVSCTRKATLSNGTVRYYGRVNNRNYWFTYSCEMDV